jgi:hypothetical protein
MIKGTLHEDLCTFMIISDDLTAYEIMYILIVEPGRPQTTIQ